MDFPAEFSSSKIVLKKADPVFASAMWALISQNKEYFIYIDSIQSLDNIEKVRDFLSEMQQKSKKQEYGYFLFVLEKLVGYVGIKIRPGEHVAELSYYLDKAETGKGYASTAVMLLEEKFFSEGGHRCEIFCNENNLKSRHLAEKLNYRLDGIMREYEYRHHRYEGVSVYSKIKGE